MFVAVDGDNDASGRFSIPRVGQVFDYNSNHFSCNDTLCIEMPHGPCSSSPFPPLRPMCMDSHLSDSHVKMPEGVGTVESEGRVVAGAGASASESFRFGLPQLRLRTPESANDTMLSQPLDRKHMLVFERFLFQRNLIVVLSEGEMRYIHPLSLDKWVTRMERHGFVLSPILPSVTNQMIKLSEGYQSHIRVTPGIGGVKLGVYHRDAICASFWTV